MTDVLWWFIAVQAVGLVTFPLAYLLFPWLADRGYSVSRPLGILFIGYASWVLSTLHILPSVRLSIVGLLLALGAVSGWYAWKHRQELKDFISRERTVIIATEVIFLAFFAAWIIYRAYDPAIDHTEQPMDFAFLNASIQSEFGIPEDPWLRGESISYYYFGYWMMGVISELTNIPSNISYNLSLALIPALAAAGMFGLVYNLVRSEANRLRYAIIAGVAAGVLLGIASNLEGVLEFMRANGGGSEGFWNWVEVKREAWNPTSELMAGLDLSNLSQSWRPEEHWWWFRASRVVDTFDGSRWLDLTIQEFPAFSFILGDLHPHVVSIPFVILFLSLSWNFLSAPIETQTNSGLRAFVWVPVMGLALGGLAFTNMWDLPTFSALFLAVVILKRYRAGDVGLWALARGVVPIVAAVIGLAILLYLPYYLNFATSVDGIQPVTAATTQPVHMFIVWGLLFVAVTPFIIGTFWQTTVRSDWPGLMASGLAVGVVPFLAWAFVHLADGGSTGDIWGRLFHILPFIFLIAVAVYTALWLARWGGSIVQVFGLALAALGLLLIMGPELLFVDDVFDNRMNTVFKLYYQAWILLAASSGLAIYYWFSLRESLAGWKRTLTTLWAGVFIVLLTGSIYYAPAAAASKGDLFRGDATLDGLTYTRPAEYQAIRFVSRHVGEGSAILEAVGGGYTHFGRISSSTGVPTVLNWPGHEGQWRGSTEKFKGREQDVARIYQTLNAEEARILLDKYDVDYVYVGPRERQKYGDKGLGKFSSFMDAVFALDDVAIYKLDRPQSLAQE